MKRILLFILPLFISAEIDFLQMKGLYNVVKPEDSYISPLHGFTWWKNNYIKHLYQFGDPKDAMVKLLHELFYLQHDQITFGPTILERNPATYFTASTIGKIVAALQEYQGKTLDEAAQKALQEKLVELIKKDIKFDELYATAQVEVARFSAEVKPFKEKVDVIDAKIKEINHAKTKLPVKIKRAKPADKADLQKQLKNMQLEVNALKEQKKSLSDNPAFKEAQTLLRQNNLTKESVDQLVALLVEAYVENSSEDSVYVPDSVYQLLTGFLWAKANDKKEYLEYFAPLKESLADPAILTPGSIQTSWLDEAFTKDDYEKVSNIINTSSESEAVDFLLEHYEQALLYAYGYRLYDVILPPIAQSIKCFYAYGLDDSEQIRFLNCGENTLRHFFNIGLKRQDADKLDVNILKNLADKSPGGLPIQLSPALVSFYESDEHTALSRLGSVNVHNAWNKVVSDLPGVHYLKPNKESGIAELDEGLSNALKVFNHLLFGNSPAFDALPSAKKLDAIVESLSDPTWKLTWNLKNYNPDKDPDRAKLNRELAQDTHITLEFSINNKHLFNYEFQKDHFIIFSLETPEYTRYAQPLVAHRTKKGKLSTTTRNILAWFITVSNYEKILNLFSENNQERFFLMLNLNLSNKDHLVAVIQHMINWINNDWKMVSPTEKDLSSRMIKKIWKLDDPVHANRIAEYIIQKEKTHFFDLALDWAKKLRVKNPKSFLTHIVHPAVQSENLKMINRLKSLVSDLDIYYTQWNKRLPAEVRQTQSERAAEILDILVPKDRPSPYDVIVAKLMNQISDPHMIETLLVKESKENFRRFQPFLALLKNLKESERYHALLNNILSQEHGRRNRLILEGALIVGPKGIEDYLNNIKDMSHLDLEYYVIDELKEGKES